MSGYSNNIQGYKIVFFIENLLREYVGDYLADGIIPKNISEDALNNARQNGFTDNLCLIDMLQWIHLGNLYDIIKSKEFNKNKSNSIENVNISRIISERNNIMHSRVLAKEELDEITDISNQLVISLNSEEYKNIWERFITIDIKNYELPDVFIDYPCGKDFKRLIGRNTEIKNLTNDVLELSQPISVIGHGGLGKTALVLQLIENFMYSPMRPFERIYLMSFKNTAYENGKIRRFEKVIANYDDLINRLALYMNVNTDYKDSVEIENEVFKEIFSKKTLLILDNLETEIVNTNLSNFIKMADRFARNVTKSSRLIITSRFGLGDIERKFPLDAFDLAKTKELVYMRLENQREKAKSISDKDWEWIHTYSQGNPSLIITFCHTLQTTYKKLSDMIIEYNSKYSFEAKELQEKKHDFLHFCFENTIDSLSEESRIYMSCISYICSQINIYEINSEFLFYLNNEVKLNELGDVNIHPTIFINIGFFQFRGTENYYINQLVIEYLNNSAIDTTISESKLKRYSWYQNLLNVVRKINDIRFDEECTVEQVLSKLYFEKYRKTKESACLLKFYMCNPTQENLIYFFKEAEPTYVLSNFTNLLDKAKAYMLNNQNTKNQNQIAQAILNSIIQVREELKKNKIKDFRQIYLLDYFKQLEQKMHIFKSNNLEKGVREKVCRVLNSLGRPELAVKYLADDMAIEKFDVYSRLILGSCNSESEKCNNYIQSCNQIISLLGLEGIPTSMSSRYYINLAQHYSSSNPQKAYETAMILDSYKRENDSIYANYLQSLLIRAKCKIKVRGRKSEVIDYVDLFKKESSGARYRLVWPRKRESLERELEFIEREIRWRYKKA